MLNYCLTFWLSTSHLQHDVTSCCTFLLSHGSCGCAIPAMTETSTHELKDSLPALRCYVKYLVTGTREVASMLTQVIVGRLPESQHSLTLRPLHRNPWSVADDFLRMSKGIQERESMNEENGAERVSQFLE